MTTWPDADVYPGTDLFTAGLGGGIFSRGETGEIWLDGAPIVAVFLGDLLLWDGTRSAFVSISQATATAQAPAPLVQSQVAAIAVPIATASAASLVPSLEANTVVGAPIAAATAIAAAPNLSADAGLAIPTATASGVASPPLSDATLTIPIATATAQGRVPTIGTTGSSNIGVPIATATASAPTPAVAVSATLVVPIATASGAAPLTAVAGNATITPPAATATASAPAPAVTVVTFQPSGMTKNGTQAWASSGTTTWVTITTWTANTGTYPGSSVTSDRLNVQGSITNATVSASIPFTGGTFSRAHQVRLVNQSGAVIGTAGATVSADSGTCTCTVTGVNLTGITSIGVQMAGTDTWCGTLSAGTNTKLTIT